MRARVVIVEDDDLVRETLKEFFEAKGLEVVAASEPLVCPIYLGKGPCACPEGTVCGDLLITDLNMPRMTGIQFIENQIKQGCKGITRNKAVISGNFRESDIERMQEIDCQWFPKPFKLTEIEAWLEACLKRIDTHRQLRIFPKK